MPGSHLRTPTPKRPALRRPRRRRFTIGALLLVLVLAGGSLSAVAVASPATPTASEVGASATAAASVGHGAAPSTSQGTWARWRCHRLIVKHLVNVKFAQSSSRKTQHRTPWPRCHRSHQSPRPVPVDPLPTTPEPTEPTTPEPTEPTTPEPTDPTGSPTPPPSGTVGCAADPSACGYPDASNTGVPSGTTLVKVPEDVTSGKGWHYDSRGWIEVDTAGATLSGITTTKNVNVTASNVTVQNSRIIVSGESFGISIRRANNVTVRNNEIAGPKASGPTRLMVGVKDVYADSVNLKVVGNDIWHTATGVQMDQGLIQDNYIHDLGFTGDDHVNGTTSNGGSKSLTIRHNTVFNPHDQTDAISLFQDFGVQANRVIDDNLLAGGGYTIYAGANRGLESTATNIKVTNNRISPKFYPQGGHFGYATAYTIGGGNAWSGNVWDDTGRSIPQP